MINISIDPKERTFSVCPNMYFDDLEKARFVATTLIELATYIVEDMDELQEKSETV